MIEYYTLMHKGSENLYRDNFFLNFGSTITVLLVYVSKNPDVVLDSQLSSKLSSLISSCNDLTFEELYPKVDDLILNKCEYLLVQINDSSIRLERHGNVYVNIIKNGELKMLPNGLFSLENDDHLVCGTGAFYKYLSSPGILSDSLSSLSSEEWMDSMTYRIAEQSGFSYGNITAVTFIVRSD